MRFARFFSVVGLVAALGATVPQATPAQAAPEASHGQTQQEQSWSRYQRAHWDPSQQWYRRTVVVAPTSQFGYSLPVRVIVPAPFTPTFATPAFVTTFRTVVLPALVQFVPQPELLQHRLRLVQVQPGVFVIAHPSLYWGDSDAWYAAGIGGQLANRYPGFQPHTFNGPLGHGVYLAYHGGWSY